MRYALALLCLCGPALPQTAKQPVASSSHSYTFEPTQFEHFFSSSIQPVLHISPGDTVKTWSVDAGGADPKGGHQQPTYRGQGA